jgi:quinol monooxygenase YgiN
LNAKQLLVITASVLATLCGQAVADEVHGRYVRLAELEIDPTQIESFNAAIREEIEAAVRVEPGVLVLYAVSVRDNPTHVRVFEVYTDEEAYRAHREAPHFKKFLETTNDMVKSRKLIEADPIILGAKRK